MRVTGPLAVHAEGFRAWLSGRGYQPASIEDHVWLMGHLSRWLIARDVKPGAFCQADAEVFQQDRRERYSHLTSRRGLKPLLSYLTEIGVVSPWSVDLGPVERLIVDYRAYLARERGLAAGSIVLRERVARLFLATLESPLETALASLTSGDVTRFVVLQCREDRRSVAWAKSLTSGLRSLLVFLHVDGRVSGPLAGAVPSVAGWRLSALPRGLEPEQVSALLHSCDRGTAVGRRDFAVLVLLSRLGLRAGEIAAMGLEDIDWYAGQLTIHGKGNQLDRLPLPHDVGTALVEHLRDRPPRRGGSRAVFMRALAPHGPLSPSAIGELVGAACERAGVPRVGSHRLRHTIATELLHAGASLVEIAPVLRHTNLSSTAIYAKVDRHMLATLARPWPLSGAAS